jgi:hypothetical protein
MEAEGISGIQALLFQTTRHPISEERNFKGHTLLFLYEELPTADPFLQDEVNQAYVV